MRPPFDLRAWVRGEGTERSALVVAHPDDETLLAAVWLSRSRARVVHATMGAPRVAVPRGFSSRVAYEAARAAEWRAAAAVLRVGVDRCLALGFEDGGLHLALEPLIRALEACLAGVDVVATHAIEGAHPDHDTLAVAARLAAPRALQLECAGYHLLAEGHFARGTFASGGEAEVVLDASPEEASRRRRALGAYRSQAALITALDGGVERFRRARALDAERLAALPGYPHLGVADPGPIGALLAAAVAAGAP